MENENNRVGSIERNAMDERDETRRWLLEIAQELDVEIPESDSGISIHEDWKKLKNLIIEKIHEQRRT